jgi:hypothetical protein
MTPVSIRALSHASIVQWDEGDARFIELPSEKSKYSYFLDSDYRFGFWGINGDNTRFFVRGKVFHLPSPPRVATWKAFASGLAKFR